MKKHATDAESAQPRRRVRRTGATTRKTADTVTNYKLVQAGVLVTLAAAIVTSWNGLMFVGGWQHLEGAWRIVTPLMIDVPLVTLTVVHLILRARGQGSVAVHMLKYSLTVYSSAANFAHSVDVGGLATLPAWGGALTNALAPFLILTMTEVLGLIMAKPKVTEAQIEAAKKKRATAARKAAKKPGAALAKVTDLALADGES